jgi:tetratricopeptide (TPR) repeat protein
MCVVETKSTMSEKRIFRLLSIVTVAITILLAGCKTTKNDRIHRWYHNTNARYNGLYYSRENMKESVKKVEKATKDDFTKLLPIYVYTDNKNAKTYYADFDKSIKKSSSCIQRHCITDKKKKEIPNACKWIDENYMLIGQSHFYKRDLFSALEAFEYVAKIYPNPKAKYNAMFWMIRTDNEIGSYSLSQELMDELRNSSDIPKDKTYQRDYALATADYYMKTGDYADAIRDLTKAIPLTKSKPVRGRYTYILAQLYEKLNDTKNASKYYGEVPGLHPNYDMVFSAKINHAKLFDTEGGDSKEVIAELTKMLKDEKNLDFRDQIYYALANIAYRQKNEELCMTYLNKSIRTSTTNTTQKALSFLKRADIYFDRPDYKRAEANYDSAMSVLPKDYPDYSMLDEKRKSLNALVYNLNIITLEDSVQRLAAMSPDQRNAAIDNMVTQIEEAEKKKEEEKQNQTITGSGKDSPGSGTTASGSSTAWYFYNPAVVSVGVSDFTKKWGNRKLEDNWFRSAKDDIMAVNNSNEDETADTTNAKGPKTLKKSKKDRNYYLTKLPLTPEAIVKSNAKIVEAYYNAGSIYKERILNNQKSVETLEELLKRFPENKYKMQCYYYLYRTYLVMNNETKANYYRDIILNNYPNSEYATLLLHPDEAKNAAITKSQVERFYAETYDLYIGGKYQEALANCTSAEGQYSKNYLMPQFAFIKALSIGRTQDVDAFENELKLVVAKYPKDAVKGKAQDILDAIKKRKDAGKTIVDHSKDSTNVANQPPIVSSNDSIQNKSSKYIFKDDGEFFWVCVIDNGKGNINGFKTKLSEENTSSFSTDDLTITPNFLDLPHQLITVKTFNGKDKAMDYYNYLKGKATVFSDLINGTYQTFIISSENYSIFYKDKNIADYQEFFSENYE